ncbi:MAG: thioredoxin family protein [Sulfurovaceae bacterium]|nr:thioredoxin family protein [Sulfurovaceae bacterium]
MFEVVIKVLGTGCTKCIALEKIVREVVAQQNRKIDVQKVDQITDIMHYSVFSTPALVINEKVVSVGKVLSQEEVAQLINEA